MDDPKFEFIRIEISGRVQWNIKKDGKPFAVILASKTETGACTFSVRFVSMVLDFLFAKDGFSCFDEAKRYMKRI